MRELYAEAERTARALLTRFKPGERIAVVGAEPARMGHARIRRGAGRHGAGHRQSGLQGERAGICAEAIARGRRVRGPCLPRQSDAGDGARGGAALPGIARDHLLRRLGFLHRRRRRQENRAANRQTDRSGDDPVYLGHDGLSERRAAASSRPCQQRRRHRRADGDRAGRRVRHHHAAVPHRRLRLLRARRGVEGRDPGAVGGIRAGPRARTVRDLSRQCHARRADHAGGDAGASLLRIHRSFLRQGDLLGRLDRAGRACHLARAETGRALHHRVRADRVLAGGGA